MKKAAIRFLVAWSLLLVLAIAVFKTATHASFNEYWVSTSGSDSNSGTSSGSPWQTWSHAIASFALGTTGAAIHGMPGTFGNINVNRGGSSPGVRLVIDCTNKWTVPSSGGCHSGVITVTTNNVSIGTISGFGFDISIPNQYSDAVNVPIGGIAHIGGGNSTTGNSVHILGNYFHDMSQVVPCLVNPNGTQAISFNNNHGAFMTDGQVIGNRFSNLGPASQSKLNGGPGCYNNYGMYISSASVRVEYNVMMNITGYAIHYYSMPCGADIMGNSITRTEFPNILIAGSDCPTSGFNSGNNNVSNNILGQTPSGVANIQVGVGGSPARCDASHPNLLANNLFPSSSNQVSINTPDQSCTTVTGSLVEASSATFAHYTGGNNDDYHLLSTSLANGSGTTSCVTGNPNCIFGLDFDGNSVPSPPSRGAYQSGGSGPPPPPSGLLTPTSIGFVNTFSGFTSNYQPITVKNTSGVAVVFTSIVASAHFGLITSATPCPIGGGGLAAGAQCEVDVTFSPNAVAPFTGTVTFTDNFTGTPASPQTVSLSGTGITPVAPATPTGLTLTVH